MTNYDELLHEVKTTFETFRRTTAHDYIPKMYEALRRENLNITPEDARDRIEKDCISIWSKRTILDALPDEAKNQEKQNSGRLGQKKRSSAAASAAPLNREEILIDTKGKAIEDKLRNFEEALAEEFSSIKKHPEEVGVTSKTISSSKECASCQELRLKVTELEDALTKRAISKANEMVQYSSSSDNTVVKTEDDNIIPFRFSLPLDYVRRYIEDSTSNINNRIWFSGTLDKRTGDVIKLLLE